MSDSPDCSVTRLNRGDGFPVGALSIRSRDCQSGLRFSSHCFCKTRVRRSLFRFEGVRCTRSSWRSLPRKPRAQTTSGLSCRFRISPARPGTALPSVLDHAPFENCIASTSIFVLPSYKEPTVDALASTTDEGRVWLRKATGSRLEGFDPWVSEWGNPPPVMGWYSGLNT